MAKLRETDIAWVAAERAIAAAERSGDPLAAAGSSVPGSDVSSPSDDEWAATAG
jgi:hypothetical protein